jgi:glutamate synthase (NADPH/NADH) large chain
MTGGRVVVLGPTGRNFGAGMSGGIAYVYDPARTFTERVNYEMVDLEPLDDEDKQWLLDTVTCHGDETESAVAARLIGSWADAVCDFVKVMPRDYRRVVEATRRAVEQGTSVDDAVMAAAHG